MASYRQDTLRKTWSVTWDIEPDPETGRRRQRAKRGFPTQRASKAWFRRYEDQQERDHPRPAAETPIATYAAKWLDGHDASQSSLHTYETCLNLYVLPSLGRYTLGELETGHVEEWHRGLTARGLSANTVHQAHAVLSAMLNTAVDREEIPRNVTRRARTLPRRVEPQEIIWTPDEINRFFAVADRDAMGLLFRIMLHSQIRPGEAVSLRWSQVNWQLGAIQVARTRSKTRAGKQTDRDGAKTPSGRRTIPLSENVMECLRQHERDQHRQRELASELWEAHDLVFCRADGKPLARDTPGYWLDKLIREAGVPRITPHGFRHLGATILMELNVHPLIVSRRLGHRHVSTTLDRYSHVSTHMQREVSDQLGELFDAPQNIHDDLLIDQSWERPDDSS